MIFRLLSFLFPPQLPSRMTGWEPPVDRQAAIDKVLQARNDAQKASVWWWPS